MITTFTTHWCPDCSRSRRVLEKHGIAFDEIDIERVPEAETAMRSFNGGSGKVPTIVLQEGERRTVLVEPSDRELVENLRAHGLID